MYFEWHIIIFLFLITICLVQASRYHAIVTIDENEKTISAYTQFEQGVENIGPLIDAVDQKPLTIEIDDLQAIKIVPVNKNFQQFAVTIGDRIIYHCRMVRRSTRSSSIATLMHLFLDDQRLKIAQGINSICFDRRQNRKHGTDWSS